MTRNEILLEACRKGLLNEVERLLKPKFLIFTFSPKANVNAIGKDGFTPLHFAVREGHREVAEFLITEGADVNAKSMFTGETPLHLAASKGHKEVAQLLVAKGAEIEAKDEFGDGNTFLHRAIWKGHLDIAELLIEIGADVNAKNKYGVTPLSFATSERHKRVAEFLIAKGAEIEAKDEFGKTYLHWAAFKGHKDVAELLIAKGAEINAKDKDSDTPLHLAASKGHKEVAQLLIAMGADINAADKHGFTPLQFAVSGRHLAVADLLIAKGADVKEEREEEMSGKTRCSKCGAIILPATAERTGGLCMPCKKDKDSIEESEKYIRCPGCGRDYVVADLVRQSASALPEWLSRGGKSLSMGVVIHCSYCHSVLSLPER